MPRRKFRNPLKGRHPQIRGCSPPDWEWFVVCPPANAFDPVILGYQGEAQEPIEFSIRESPCRWSSINPNGGGTRGALSWTMSEWGEGGQPLGRGLVILVEVPQSRDRRVFPFQVIEDLRVLAL